MKHLLTFAIVLLSFSLCGQISFTNANHRLQGENYHSGVAIGIADMNDDGLDDIVRLANGRVLNIELQRAGDQQFQNISLEQVSGQSQWSMCMADVNNDGFNEVFCGGAYDGVHLIRASNDGATYEMEDLPGQSLFIQGSNLVDINNDGYIDFFACHDDAESRIWANDGSGNFIQADEWIDMATDPPSDNSGNYGSIWTDFDHDGDIDLYIAKCRQGVNSPSDPRRINALFVNDGNGNFTEQAAASNLKIGAQSWTADFQDIDNDGDYDCFITNHDVPSMLLENDGSGVFTDITGGSGIDIGGLPIQGVMRDFDNDGFVDILVAGSEHFLFRNNGDKTFTEVEGLFDENDMESYAIGDLNHDGFLDIYGGYAEIYTNPTSIDDVIWLNEGNDNNFFSVRLIGQESNRNGIGARIEIYGDWGIQVREVRAGESYGIMNSMTQHFGLGAAAAVDSLIVRWPSGQVDQHESLTADQFVTVLEGECVSPQATIEVEGNTTFCQGDSILLTASAGLNYLWSTGDTTQSIWATTAGGYTVEVNDGGACTSNSPLIEVSTNPDETPSITVEGDLRFCEGESVYLVASDAASHAWSNGAVTQFIEVTESGEYMVTIEGQCEEFESAPVAVDVLPSAAPEFLDYQEVDPDSVEVTVSGSNVYWFESEISQDPFTTGNTINIPIVDNQAIAFAENHELYPGSIYQTGMLAHQGGAYSGNQYNGAVVFDCFNPFTLREVSVYTDTEGPRIIQLRAQDGTVLQSTEVNVQEGVSVLSLDFEVEPGTNLALTTDESFNQSTYGFASPRFQRSDEGISYPYIVDDLIQINTSNFGSDRYYYFFDWKVREPSFECISDRTEVGFFILDTEEASSEDTRLKLAPNPASQAVHIQLPKELPSDYTLQLLNSQGQVVKQASLKDQFGQYELGLQDIPAGLYHLKLQNEISIYTGKLVIR